MASVLAAFGHIRTVRTETCKRQVRVGGAVRVLRRPHLLNPPAANRSKERGRTTGSGYGTGG